MICIFLVFTRVLGDVPFSKGTEKPASLLDVVFWGLLKSRL